MIDKEKVKAAVKEMTEANQDWKDILLNAPGAANLRIALAFYASKNLDAMSQPEKDEYREFREMLEALLNAEEFKYLAEAFGRMGMDVARDHYNELFQNAGGEAAVGAAGKGLTSAPKVAGSQGTGAEVQSGTVAGERGNTTGIAGEQGSEGSGSMGAGTESVRQKGPEGEGNERQEDGAGNGEEARA